MAAKEIYDSIVNNNAVHNRIFGTTTESKGSGWKKLFDKVKTLFSKPIINPNVVVSPNFPTVSKLVLKTDCSFLQALDPETLEPKCLFAYSDINPEFKGVLSAAHS